MSDQKPTIEAGRRRPGGAAAPTGRAEAPSRRRSDAGGGGLPPTSGGGRSPESGLPGGLPKKMSIGSVVLLILLYFAIRLFSGGTGTGTDTTDYAATRPEEIAQATSLQAELPRLPTNTPRPTRTLSAAGAGKGDTWLVMLYQDADDQILEKDIFLDLNEAEKVGSSPEVQIVAQIDRYRGGFQGDGDWVSARRYFVTQDDDLQQVNSRLVKDLGEVNMADGKTLVDFVTWAMASYPADRYALILSDHGMGWPGGWSDQSSRGTTDRSLPLASVAGNMLYLHELDQALGDIRSQTGLDKFELIGMDACLMGHLEVLSALSSHARYAVTSQETEPALGWAYSAFLSELTANPGMNGAGLGEAIVNSYISEDQRIVDDQARADLVGRGLPMNSLFGTVSIPSAAQVTSEMVTNVTLAAIDLSAVPELMTSFDDLAFALQGVDQRNIAQARSYAQSFTSIFGKEVPPSYIDLGHFAQLVGRISGKPTLSEAANQLLEVLGRAVIAERHGPKKPGATGISIYFPNSELYRSPDAGPDSYNVAAQRFVSESLWDEFLAYHYTGRAFERGERMVTAPERGVSIKAPAAGGIQMTSLQASSRTVAPGESIRLTSDISGANIGYVRLLVGFLDKANNSLAVLDSDYLTSPQTRQLNGIYYPDWGTGAFTLAFSWEPIVFEIGDGATSAVALLNPENYGASAEEAVYSVDGTYTFAESGEKRHARLYFSNGQLRQVFGFSGEVATGAMHEITPQTGDQFTILEKWMDLDNQGNVTNVAEQEGETLTFGTQMFTWKQVYAAPGNYIVGFIAEDLDGNSQPSYVQVTVR